MNGFRSTKWRSLPLFKELGNAEKSVDVKLENW